MSRSANVSCYIALIPYMHVSEHQITIVYQYTRSNTINNFIAAVPTHLAQSLFFGEKSKDVEPCILLVLPVYYCILSIFLTDKKLVEWRRSFRISWIWNVNLSEECYVLHLLFWLIMGCVDRTCAFDNYKVSKTWSSFVQDNKKPKYGNE